MRAARLLGISIFVRVKRTLNFFTRLVGGLRRLASSVFYNDFNALWIRFLFGISLALSLLPEKFLTDCISLVQRSNFVAGFTGNFYQAFMYMSQAGSCKCPVISTRFFDWVAFYLRGFSACCAWVTELRTPKYSQRGGE